MGSDPHLASNCVRWMVDVARERVTGDLRHADTRARRLDVSTFQNRFRRYFSIGAISQDFSTAYRYVFIRRN